jgi:hypothetical protein
LQIVEMIVLRPTPFDARAEVKRDWGWVPMLQELVELGACEAKASSCARFGEFEYLSKNVVRKVLNVHNFDSDSFYTARSAIDWSKVE